MTENVIDFSGNTLQVEAVEAETVTVNGTAVDTTPAASAVQVAAYATSGISADDLQAVLEALADRIQALEDAVE